MPTYKPETEKAKAENLTKLYLEENMSQIAVAKREGVTKQAIHQRIHRPAVQSVLQKYFESEKLNKRLVKVAKEGLRANRIIQDKLDNIEDEETNSSTIPDHNVRHKFWRDILIIKGKLKPNGNGKGVSVSNVIINIRDKSGLCSRAETEIVSSERGEV